MSDKKNENVDELQYEWPQNVLSYERRFWFGLTANDLMVSTVLGILLFPIHPLMIPVGALVGLLLSIRIEPLGNRRIPAFLVEYLKHRFNRQPVILPLVLPADKGEDEFLITNSAGEEIARIGGGR